MNIIHLAFTARHRWRQAISGLVCLFAGLAASAQLTDVATNATDPGNLSDTEPSIAVNPANPQEIVITTFSEAWTALRGAPVWRSTDGGTTWNKVFILPRPGASSAPGDQKVQFNNAGQLMVAELGMGIVQPRCLIFRQTGAPGTNLTGGGFYGDDQPMLDVDKSAGAFANRVYSAWLDFAVANPVSTVARSTNNGQTVTNVVAGNNASFPNRTTRSAVDRDGRAYIVFKTREGAVAGGFENAHFNVKRSDDGGVSWNALGAAGVSVHGAPQMQTWFTTSWGNAAKGKVARARSSDAWIAADPGDGDIYVAYCDRDASGFGQIYLARSTDHGATWTNTRITDGTHHSAFPEVAVASNGTVGVLYVDFDDAGAATIFRHRFARSFDNGATWSHENLQSMNPGPIANASDGFLWGDYEGLTAQGLYFYGVFTGQSIGRATVQLDPIFFKRRAFRWVFPPVTICDLRPWLCQFAVLEKGLIRLKCDVVGCKIFDPLPRNCLVKYDCPGCSPAGLCPPPYYIMKFEGLEKAWDIQLLDPTGKEVKIKLDTRGDVTVLSFSPKKEFMPEGKIGDYMLVFSMKKGISIKKEFEVKTSIEASDKPYGQ